MKRNDLDYYPTPSWCLYSLMDEIVHDAHPVLNQPLSLLEPSAGRGNLIRAFHTWVSDHNADFIHRKKHLWTSYEVDSKHIPYLEKHTDSLCIYGDFLNDDCEEPFDLAIMNPPYNRAFEFVEKAVRLCDEVWCILRLDWLGSIQRNSWLQRNKPNVYVLPNRPPFKGQRNDTCPSAWFVWKKHSNQSILKVLPVVPLEKRKQCQEEDRLSYI